MKIKNKISILLFLVLIGFSQYSEADYTGAGGEGKLFNFDWWQFSPK